MNDDITINPEKTNRGMQELQHQELFMEKTDDVQMEQQMRMHAAQGVCCPHCGSINESGTMFCASCGNPLERSSIQMPTSVRPADTMSARMSVRSVAPICQAMRLSVLSVVVRVVVSSVPLVIH